MASSTITAKQVLGTPPTVTARRRPQTTAGLRRTAGQVEGFGGRWSFGS